ncbi:MAG: DUF2254 domain-containing protein [Saprospiraceae bacterium]|nr:DUF2254 domain-containing protein [Saprospiraceae bacterium]
MKKLLFFWRELKATFWFIPVLLISIAIILSLSLLYLDNLIEYRPEGITQLIFPGSASAAHQILSTISGAMIGVAGTVFSITLVALTLASSQFGPRLIRNFMYDQLNQIVLGSYAATYVYCLIVLNTIKENDQFSFIPSFSILFALIATIVNIILLVIFFHHITMNIQADNIISDISSDMSKNLDSLFSGDVNSNLENARDVSPKSLKETFAYQKEISAEKYGYLRYLDRQSLLEIAKEKDMLIEIYFRPGDFVVKDQKLGMVYSHEETTDEDLEAYQRQFIFGKTRSKEQDLEHSIHQLVEIASRALSPGINDPYTAISCINHLSSIMSSLVKKEFPAPYLADEEGAVRVIADVLTFEGMLDAAFNQIRQFSRGNPSVAIRMMESLRTIYQFCHDDRKEAVTKHAQMILNLAEKSFEEKNDLEDLQRRSDFIS